jgi:GNAT superfamily N-acetyltransferase
MIIRYAQWEDCERIGELWLALVEFHVQLDPNMPKPSLDGMHRYAQRIASHLNDPYAQTLVAEVDGQIVGYATAMVLDLIPDMFVGDASGMIGDIFVLEAHQRHGIGRALVQTLEDWFRLRGVTHYEWYVAHKNHSGKAFWQAQGGQDITTQMRRYLNEQK